MKVISVLAISATCSISFSFLAVAQPASALTETEPNDSFDTRQFLPSGTNTVDGELNFGDLDFFTFSGLSPGNLFTASIDSPILDPLLGRLDDAGNILDINDDRSDRDVLPLLTGEIAANGNLNLAVSGLRDIDLTGNHFESGLYTLSLNTFALPQASTNPTLINGGFETGNFTGWTTLGETSINTSAFGSGPTEENSQALLLTGGTAFSDSIIENFLGLEPGSLDTLAGNPVNPPQFFPAIATQGSAIQQQFTAKAGDILSFDWNFLTNEELIPPFNDFSFLSIIPQSNTISTVLQKLADTTSQPQPVSQTQFYKETGFNTFSYTIPTTGVYTLGLGVFDAGIFLGGNNVTDTATDSGLLIDNVKITSVPEPTSVLGILGFGVLGVSSVLKCKQRQKIDSGF